MRPINDIQLRELIAAGTKLPWALWTSNSHRRIGSGLSDGNVLWGTRQSDGFDDLAGSNVTNDLNLIIAAVNALPDLLKDRERTRRLIYDQIDQAPSSRHIREDDDRPRPAWATLLRDAGSGLARVAHGVDGDQWRHCLIGVAALCVAAIEAHDRTQGMPIISEHTLPTETPSFDPRCGSQGIDEDGHCMRCGLRVHAGEPESCPPGFLTPDGSP